MFDFDRDESCDVVARVTVGERTFSELASVPLAVRARVGSSKNDKQ